MSMVLLLAAVIGVLFIAAVAFLLLPERWYSDRLYTDPAALFSFVAGTTILVALFMPHA